MSFVLFKNRLKRIYKHILNRFAGCFNPIEKKIAFESYNGRQYSDNPRFISEKMHEMFPDYKLVWGMQDIDKNKSYKIPDYVTVLPIDSWKYLKERASSFAFVRNEAMSGDLCKRKGQIYIQTWHGDRGIKKILFDSLAARGVSEKDYSIVDNKLTDYFVVGSSYAEERIKTAFRYNGKVINSGCPRNDCLINVGDINSIKQGLGISSEYKILLYAPTLRRNSKVVQATVDIKDTLNHLTNKYNCKWICLVRAHPKSLGIDLHKDNNIIDVSGYPDIADLLMISDFMITDYSSCAGDFILTKRPLVLAQFDLEQYMEEDRTFHVDINDIGYLIARTQEELDSYIDSLSDSDYQINCQTILDYFGTYESGHSAEDVCKLIERLYTGAD